MNERKKKKKKNPWEYFEMKKQRYLSTITITRKQIYHLCDRFYSSQAIDLKCTKLSNGNICWIALPSAENEKRKKKIDRQSDT